MKIDFAALKFNVHGYINAIVQDAGTDEVLALVKMDGEALARTAENGSLPVPEPDGIHGVLAEIYRLICYKRQHGGDNSAARHLVMSGQDKILKQLGADTSSTIIASKNDSRTEVLDEMSGLWYDCLVLLAYHNINPAELLATLGDKRAK